MYSASSEELCLARVGHTAQSGLEAASGNTVIAASLEVAGDGLGCVCTALGSREVLRDGYRRMPCP